MFLGTLWSSFKQIKAPYVFDGQNGITLHTVQGIRALSLGELEVSCFFLIYGGNLGYILELQWAWPFKTPVCSATSGLLSIYGGHLRNILKAWQGNTEASTDKAGDQVTISSCQSDIGIPINFQEESGAFTF